jgi:hypothetical protein
MLSPYGPPPRHGPTSHESWASRRHDCTSPSRGEPKPRHHNDVPSDVEELGRDGDAVSHRSRDRAIVGVKTEDAFDRGAVLFGNTGELVCHVNALDDEDLAVLLHVTDAPRYEGSAACMNVARLQRASQGAGQSTDRCGDDVVDRRCVWRVFVCGDSVMLGDCPVDAERHLALIAR